MRMNRIVRSMFCATRCVDRFHALCREYESRRGITELKTPMRGSWRTRSTVLCASATITLITFG